MSRRRFVATLAFCVASIVATATAVPASAAAPDQLLRFPRGDVASGAGAGQLNNPRHIAGDRNDGHLFVSENGTNRVSEFTAWGTFVAAWGWDVAPDGTAGDTAADQFEVCTTACQAGSLGSGVGQLNRPTGMAVDGAGNVYVYDLLNARVQKFSPDGQFLLMFGDGVNQGPGSPGDVCTAAHVTAGDICGAGSTGAGDAQLSTAIGNYLAYNPGTNTIFVGDTDMIQEFNLDGTFKSKIAFSGELAKFAGKTVTSLAVDSAGDLYIALSGMEGVHKLSAAGELLPSAAQPLVLPVKEPFGIAVDAEDNVYVIEKASGGNFVALGHQYVLGFTALGQPIPGMEADDEFARTEPEDGRDNDLIGLGANHCAGSDLPGNLYVTRFGNEPARSFVDAYGTAPLGCEPQPSVPPEILAQYAVSVDSGAAVLRAEINPRFWPDTTYQLQFGTAECPQSGWTSGCKVAPAEPATLTDKYRDAALRTALVSLAGLEPGTTYHYRFIATSGGGGPVVGVGGKPGEEGAAASFRTFPLPSSAPSPCGNARFRNGPGALLPDCRAYEMVSPLDKNNGDIVVPLSPSNIPTSLNQAALAGDGFAYSAGRSFGDADGAPLSSQYLARRSPGAGWTSDAISPPRTRPLGDVLEREFKAFSPDLCRAWLRHDSELLLDEDAAAGRHYNLYRIDYCAGGDYEALTEVEPHMECNVPEVPGELCPHRYFPLELQGLSRDPGDYGAEAIYIAPDALTEDAGPNDTDRPQLYHWSGGQLRYVCRLQNGNPIPSAQGCMAAGGSGGEQGKGRRGNLHDALSADGSLVYWTAGLAGPKTGEPGSLTPEKLYLRENPGAAQSAVVGGKCTEVDKACTYPVSQTVSGSSARFWAAADDGYRAIFSIGVNLYEYEFAKAKAGEAPTTLIASGAQGVLGASEDASRIYFVSTEVLTGDEENSEEDKAIAGQPNLYLRERDPAGTSTVTFVATLAAPDIGSAVGAAVSHRPDARLSRVTADGQHAAFVSHARLTDYENVDVASGSPAGEVYLYDAGTEQLLCASCNPSGARPSASRVPTEGNVVTFAARLPAWDGSLYAPRALSDDGGRLFFESFDALLPRDTNGVQDVYQWEAAGKGGCDGADASFVPAAGGCVDLISSGESPRASSFLDASASGEDVFFTTLASLVPQDYGLVDVYDARVGGGFPPPAAPKPPCQGEACQGPPPPPGDPTPSSSTFRGPGNVSPTPRKRRCAKGKRRVVRKGKVRCVKKRQRKQMGSQGRRGVR